MKKLILLVAFLFACTSLFAQEKAKSQYLMIVRFKTNFKPSSNEEIQNNIKKWQEYMGNLAQSGDLVAGYRPTNEGATISGKEKSTKPIPYVANDDLVSSVLIIKAENMDAAKVIANKCPVFELGGSVEVRAMMNVAGQ
ncbi:MAG: hypothetical protein JO080_08735 [Mucilaginibacter sp.]|nr:hypothetical protein [Mucilaginibacter sp.]